MLYYSHSSSHNQSLINSKMKKIKLFTLILFTWSAYGAPSRLRRLTGSTIFKKCLEWQSYEPILPFIIGGGGKPVREFEYPFMAALGYGNESNRKYFCGGSLISEEFVLTSAHCIFSAAERQFVSTVRLGDLNIKNEDDDGALQEIKVSRFIVHPNYTRPEKYNDIALIKLEKHINFTRSVRPVCLDFGNYSIADDTVVYAAGWGNVGYGEKPSDDLLKFKLLIYDLDTCQKTYGKYFTIPDGILGDSQICAGTIETIEGLTDTCEGDSGGPLLYEGYHDFFFTQIGITSFGVPCAIAPLPAVYTKVHNYIKWIEDVVWPEANETLDPNRIVFSEV